MKILSDLIIVYIVMWTIYKIGSTITNNNQMTRYYWIGSHFLKTLLYVHNICMCQNAKQICWNSPWIHIFIYVIWLRLCVVVHHSDNRLINWWKTWIDFVQIKFHSNENIEWHCSMHLNLNWNSIWFNLDLIESNSNTLIGIWIDFNKILIQQLN